MSNLLWVIALAITFICGILLGRWVRKIYEAMDDLYSMTQPSPPVKTGGTLGSYNTPPDPAAKRKPVVHVVTPKSPERMEWERNNRKPDFFGPEK